MELLIDWLVTDNNIDSDVTTILRISGSQQNPTGLSMERPLDGNLG